MFFIFCRQCPFHVSSCTRQFLQLFSIFSLFSNIFHFSNSFYYFFILFFLFSFSIFIFSIFPSVPIFPFHFSFFPPPCAFESRSPNFLVSHIAGLLGSRLCSAGHVQHSRSRKDTGNWAKLSTSFGQQPHGDWRPHGSGREDSNHVDKVNGQLMDAIRGGKGMETGSSSDSRLCWNSGAKRHVAAMCRKKWSSPRGS